MSNKVNVSLEIIPQSNDHKTSQLVKEAVKVIKDSGVRYTVGAFETVMEGDYDTLMQVVKEAQQAVLDAGAEENMSFIKVFQSKKKEPDMEERINKVKE